MKKRLLIATLLVFSVWEVLDLVLHGLLLAPLYAATAQLWRPMDEIKQGLMVVVTLIAAFTFTYIYFRFIGNKCAGTGWRYGLWFGIGAGISMGYGTYSVMPIPYFMALGWFLGTLVQTLAGGWIIGLIIREPKPEPGEAAA
jgi:hypothetical protein